LVALILEHYEAMLSDYGSHVGVRVARKHLDWYIEALRLDLARETRRALLGAETPGEVIGMIPSIYGGEWKRAA
jgi:tRNA-dihydrouridine synthase B